MASEDNNNNPEEDNLVATFSEFINLEDLIADPKTLKEILVHVRDAKETLDAKMSVLEKIIIDKLPVPVAPKVHQGTFTLDPRDQILPPLTKQKLILQHSGMKKIVFLKSEKEKTTCWDVEITIEDATKRIPPKVDLKALSYTFELPSEEKEIAFYVRFIPNIDQQPQKKATVKIDGEIYDENSTTAVNKFSFEQVVVPASTYSKQKPKSNPNSPKPNTTSPKSSTKSPSN